MISTSGAAYLALPHFDASHSPRHQTANSPVHPTVSESGAASLATAKFQLASASDHNGIGCSTSGTVNLPVHLTATGSGAALLRLSIRQCIRPYRSSAASSASSTRQCIRPYRGRVQYPWQFAKFRQRIRPQRGRVQHFWHCQFVSTSDRNGVGCNISDTVNSPGHLTATGSGATFLAPSSLSTARMPYSSVAAI